MSSIEGLNGAQLRILIEFQSAGYSHPSSFPNLEFNLKDVMVVLQQMKLKGLSWKYETKLILVGNLAYYLIN